MKAQVALLEVLLASTVITAAVAVGANLAYEDSLARGSLDPRLGNAFYDFAGALYANATLARCFAAGNYTCERAFLGALRATYGIGYVELAMGNSTVSLGGTHACQRSIHRCLPLAVNGTFRIGCMYACSD